MADLLHIDQRVLSRLKYEKGAGISEDTLRVMIEHVSEDPDEQARFLACYLRDRICGPDDVTSRIRITVEDSARLREEDSPPEDLMHLATAAAKKAVRDPTARAILTTLAQP